MAMKVVALVGFATEPGFCFVVVVPAAVAAVVAVHEAQLYVEEWAEVDSAADRGFYFVVVVPVAVAAAVAVLEAPLVVVGFVIQPDIRLAVDVLVPVPVRVPAGSVDLIVATGMGLPAVVVPVAAAVVFELLVVSLPLVFLVLARVDLAVL
ncbi:Hypothetical protein PENO1_085890 [Penicillium occitanis (nom. inval.)]|nr:Hypothetical protein PENO1_085890 [Penicillium occitanis (nom. inval.)]PCG93192.1 hypothetical protein PENOC_088950 [Penicillium occitanis (nom. inval.)]